MFLILPLLAFLFAVLGILAGAVLAIGEHAHKHATDRRAKPKRRGRSRRGDKAAAEYFDTMG